MPKPTISYSDPLEDDIQKLIDAGFVDGRSEFFQRSAAAYMMLIQTGLEPCADSVLEADNLDDATEQLKTVQEAAHSNL